MNDSDHRALTQVKKLVTRSSDVRLAQGSGHPAGIRPRRFSFASEIEISLAAAMRGNL